MKKIAIISIICICIDQLSKIIISNVLKLNSCKEIISNFYYMCNAHNDGAAWSILSGSRYFLILVPFIVIPIIYYFFIRNKKIGIIETISYGMLIGGIIGNLIDRIIYGYVIDFFDFIIFGYDFPIFNIADTCIVISIILIILFVRDDKNEISSK